MVRQAEIAAWPSTLFSYGSPGRVLPEEPPARGLVIARIQPHPRGEVTGRGEAGDGRTDFGEDHVGGARIHSGDDGQ